MTSTYRHADTLPAARLLTAPPAPRHAAAHPLGTPGAVAGFMVVVPLGARCGVRAGCGQ